MNTTSLSPLHALNVPGKEGPLLQLIADLVLRCIGERSILGKVLASRELDSLVLEAGSRLLSNLTIRQPAQSYNPLSVILATELFTIGGHGRVVEDYLRILGPERTAVIVTQAVYQGRETDDTLYARLERQGYRVIRAYRPDPADAARLLMEILSELAPQTVHLFNHHHDAAIIAAAQPGLAERFVYFHHCDHQLALGNCIPHALHVDTFDGIHHQCRHHLGIQGNLLIPLSVPDLGQRGRRVRRQPRTCACGHYAKFAGGSPGRDYFDAIPRMLAATGGWHFHVGPLLPEQLARLAKGMDACSVGQDRFIHIPSTPSLHRLLLDHDVDYYLYSFPIGGGRARLEAHAAGIPVIYPVHTDLGDVYQFTPQDAPVWDTEEDLISLVNNPDLSEYHRLAQASRRYYEEFHNEACLRDFLLALPGDPPSATSNPPAVAVREQACLLEDYLGSPAGEPLAQTIDTVIRQSGAIPGTQSAVAPAPADAASQQLQKDRAQHAAAMLLVNLGQAAEGVALLLELAQSGTGVWEVYNDLGAYALSQKDVEGAQALFEEARRLGPAGGLPTRNLAALAAEANARDEAIALYGEVLRANPDDPAAHAALPGLLSISPPVSASVWQSLVHSLRGFS